ncbi:MAG: hypothetical protein JETT_3738 [Candidatus Jettenia ecosi]|uniref:Uncharacterized protein n=1 Tax=Candidatus Jettenia ecosi TaxID=2494326 RepID=A0A533Q655_9BACT|nr:MAG: hypothetical protein JETT_3738 [Candidatus Jettenia ecosi]
MVEKEGLKERLEEIYREEESQRIYTLCKVHLTQSGSESTKGINFRHGYELCRQPLSIFTTPLIKLFEGNFTAGCLP